MKTSLRANAIADMNLGEINELFDVAKIPETLGTEPESRVLCRASGSRNTLLSVLVGATVPFWLL